MRLEEYFRLWNALEADRLRFRPILMTALSIRKDHTLAALSPTHDLAEVDTISMFSVTAGGPRCLTVGTSCEQEQTAR